MVSMKHDTDARSDVFSIGEDRPTLARLLLSLNPDLVRVFSIDDRRKMLDLLEKTYPGYLSPIEIAQEIGGDNKSVSNVLGYLVESTSMVESRHHGYRLSNELMRLVEGRFEKVSYGLGLVVFFAISCIIVLVFNASSIILPLIYLAICFGGVYSYSKRRRRPIFMILTTFMVVGLFGYVMWASSEQTETEMSESIINEAVSSLYSVQGLFQDLGRIPVPETSYINEVETKLEKDLTQTARLLRIISIQDREEANSINRTIQNLDKISDTDLVGYYLNTEHDKRKHIEERLARITDNLKKILVKKRVLFGLGPRTTRIDQTTSSVIEGESSQLLSLLE